MTLPRSTLVCRVAVLALFLGAVPAQAAVISSGTYIASISNVGSLVDSDGVVFRRVADSYDPLLPGTPREAWGVSAGGVGGTADISFFGVNNLVLNSAVFGVSTASTSTFLNNGSNILQIDQAFSFAADNVLKIATTITNVSGANQAVLYTRHVDWDVSPTVFSEIITIDPFSSPVVAATFDGFQDPNPLVPFGGSSGPGGGTFGPGDLGGGFRLDLGILASGASTSFNVFHALSHFGQSHTGLNSQLLGLGATFVITGHNSGTTELNSAAVAFGPAAAGAEVPEPGTLSMFGLLAAGAGFTRFRRQPRR